MPGFTSKVYLPAIVAVFFWSTVASAFKITLRYLNPAQMLFYSIFFSLLALSFILIAQKKLLELKKSSFNDVRNSIILSFLNPFLYYLILFKAYSLLPAQQAQPLNFTWGIVIALLSIPLLKQKVKMKIIAAVFVSFFGVVIIATDGDLLSMHFTQPLGVALAVGSSLIWSLYWIFNAKDGRDAVIKLFLNFCFGFLFIALFVSFRGDFIFPQFKGLLGTIYIGFFEMGFTFFLWLTALERAAAAANISILIYLSPFLSFLFINLFVGEDIRLSSFIGLLFIIGGIIWQQSGNLFRRKKLEKS